MTRCSTTARRIRLGICALAALAATGALATTPKHKPVVKPATTTATTTPPSPARPDAGTFNALPKLAPVSDISDAAQTSGTTAANDAQIRRQQAFDAAEKAREDKMAADMAAYDKSEARYKATMEAWDKQVAACKAGDRSQCGPPVATMPAGN
jgi:hypothetical protein